MAKRRESDWWSGQSAPIPKRLKSHRVSESENEEDYSDDESSGGRFADPNSFLQRFGGYASDENEEYESSDEKQGMVQV
jgi:hypothetical protein